MLQHSNLWVNEKGLQKQKKVFKHCLYGRMPSNTFANGVAYDLFRLCYILINRVLGHAVPQVGSLSEEFLLGISF